MKKIMSVGLVCLISFLTACSTLQPAFETPSVTITSFKAVPSNGMAPEFVIGLHVVNPNLAPLTLKGMSYKASIEGRRVLVGASNDLPIVAGYGEADFTVTATADLLSGLKLITELISLPREQLKYQLAVKLNVGGFLPDIKVNKEGELKLGAR